MLTLPKTPGKDFVLVNISDPHITLNTWAPDHPTRKIVTYTLKTLIDRVHPDLITVSGDLSQGPGYTGAYLAFCDFMDSFGIPWAIAWGNHDNSNQPAYLADIGARYLARSPHLRFEAGPSELGVGNYVLAIEQEGKPVHAILLMDTHDYDLFLDSFSHLGKGCYGGLRATQLIWYRDQIAQLKACGCNESTLITHIPIYGYRQAYAAAVPDALRKRDAVSIADSYAGIGWRDGFKDSCFGVTREGSGSCDYDEHALDILLAADHTHQLIAGHDHINNTSILYRGIRFTYSMKIGPGAYWDTDLNGGTVLRIGDDGSATLSHEYVDASHLI